MFIETLVACATCAVEILTVRPSVRLYVTAEQCEETAERIKLAVSWNIVYLWPVLYVVSYKLVRRLVCSK